jgi:hypothetical protein
MKRVLVVSFSQTGQLEAVVRNIIAPLHHSPDVAIRRIFLKPANPHPFPWPVVRFFDAFPECVYLDPAPIEPVAVAPAEDYDLIIIAYQVWFLSPSMPVTAFLQSEAARRLLRGKPVITIIACRNMWVMAQEKMKTLLKGIGARLIDNVALTDRGGVSTFITTPRWMLTGRTNRLWGMPAPGIAHEDIAACDRFGHALVRGLAEDQDKDGKPMLCGLRAVAVDMRLAEIERLGHRGFKIWGRLLRAIGKPGSPQRAVGAMVFALYLTMAILLVMPVAMLVRALASPLTAGRSPVEKERLEAPSGSSDDRMRHGGMSLPATWVSSPHSPPGLTVYRL